MRSGRRGRPRILMLRFGYFLERELMAAFARSRAEVAALRLDDASDDGGGDYAEALARKVAEARPDVLFSVNGLGLDEGGKLPALLGRLGVRCATWFVDSPELFLHGAQGLKRSGVVALCCDPDARAKLAPTGLDEVHVLPLAADATRFDLDAPVPEDTPADAAPVAFLGTSWEDKLALARTAYPFPEAVLRRHRDAGEALASAPFRGTAMDALRERCPEFAEAVLDLDVEGRRSALHLACWAGNRRYRLDRVRRLGGLGALVAGDEHWPGLLAGHGAFATAPPVGYYTPDVARLYRASAVNFCCGGVQMSAAVTQRAFDVPAAGGFALSDARPQLDALFDTDSEAATYHDPAEIPELTARWLADRPAARAVTTAARKRIRAHHTYDHRVATLLDILDQG